MTYRTDLPFGLSQESLAQFRYAAAGFIKHLILARGKQDRDFISSTIRRRWQLDEINWEGRSVQYLLTHAKAQWKRLAASMGSENSMPVPTSDDEFALANLQDNVFLFVAEDDLVTAISQARQCKRVAWESLARWETLDAIRQGLDALPEPFAQSRPPRRMPGSANSAGGSLHLQLDGSRYVVTRAGYDDEVDLSSSKLLWGLLTTFAGTMERECLSHGHIKQLWRTFGKAPGPSDSTVKDAFHELNKKLADLGIRIKCYRNVGRRLESLATQRQSVPKGRRSRRTRPQRDRS
jgi:hypothetical protein